MNNEFPESNFNIKAIERYFDIEESLSNLISSFTKILKDHPTAFIQKVAAYYEGGDHYEICEYVEKTPTEKAEWLKAKKKAEKQQEEWELRQLKELQKKYSKSKL